MSQAPAGSNTDPTLWGQDTTRAPQPTGHWRVGTLNVMSILGPHNNSYPSRIIYSQGLSAAIVTRGRRQHGASHPRRR
eukprot:scaffold45464_cov63-Phaeocystis_antarctica.AAC.2